jgi:excisionase family DNA binding protein
MTTSTDPAVKRERLEAATYTVCQLADLLGVSERHVHRLRDQKAIPGEIRIGKCVRFARVVVDRWLSDGASA